MTVMMFGSYFYVFSSVLVSTEKKKSNAKDSVKPHLQTPRSFVKNTPSHVVFSILISVFGNVIKLGLSCLIYCFITNVFN